MKKIHPFIIIPACAVVLLTGGVALFSQTVKDIMMNKRGVELGESNRLDEAIREFDKAIDLRDKATAKVYHNKGFALEQKDDLQGAIKNYEEAWKRNPRQIVTGERLGFSYYRIEDYDRAVLMGEAVLRIDPQNKEIPRWLPDAYRKRVEKRQDALKDEQRRKDDEIMRKLDEKDREKAEQMREKEKDWVFYFALDGMFRSGLFYGHKSHMMGLYNTSPHGFRVLTDRGLVVDVPVSLTMKIKPVPVFEIDLKAEKPWLGGQMPNFIVQAESVEFLFHIKTVTFGAGFMVNHYDSNAAFYRRYKLWDPKVGIIGGYRKDDVDLKLTWYPRMLWMDPSSSTGKTLDTGRLRIDYEWRVKSFIKIYALIDARDYYVFCHSLDWRVFYASLWQHSENVADYWGVYDIGLGVSFIDLVYRADDIKFNLSFDWTERFYLRSLEKEAPYTLAPNGQGWFGLDLRKWSKGKPFSGFHGISQVLGLRFDEQLSKNFFMYQKIILELADQNAEHHEFNFLAGMGFKI